MAAYRSSPLPAQAGLGADVNVMVGTVEPSDGQGSGVDRIVATAPAGFATVTGAATNNVQITVRQLRAGAVVATLGTLVFNAGTNLVAETPVTIPTAGSFATQPGDVIDALLHQNGTLGMAVGAGVVVEVTVN